MWNGVCFVTVSIISRQRLFVIRERRCCQERLYEDYLDYESEVESLRHEDGDGEGGLLAGLGGEIEHEDGQVEDANAGNDQVHDVEQGLPPDLQVKEDI